MKLWELLGKESVCIVGEEIYEGFDVHCITKSKEEARSLTMNTELSFKEKYVSGKDDPKTINLITVCLRAQRVHIEDSRETWEYDFEIEHSNCLYSFAMNKECLEVYRSGPKLTVVINFMESQYVNSDNIDSLIESKIVMQIGKGLEQLRNRSDMETYLKAWSIENVYKKIADNKL